jgi:hypothetical protein
MSLRFGSGWLYVKIVMNLMIVALKDKFLQLLLIASIRIAGSASAYNPRRAFWQTLTNKIKTS